MYSTNRFCWNPVLILENLKCRIQEFFVEFCDFLCEIEKKGQAKSLFNCLNLAKT